MVERITVEYVGKSKKFPDKFCSIKDTNGKWWSDGINKMPQYKKGETYDLHTETNARGFEDIKKALLVHVDKTPVDKTQSVTQAKDINGPERGGIFHDIVPLLAAGRSIAEVVKIMKDANEVYAILKGWKDAPTTKSEEWRPDSNYAAQEFDGEFED